MGKTSGYAPRANICCETLKIRKAMVSRTTKAATALAGSIALSSLA
jgi:hypothetical protein